MQKRFKRPITELNEKSRLRRQSARIPAIASTPIRHKQRAKLAEQTGQITNPENVSVAVKRVTERKERLSKGAEC
jgi:hypothetical protein